MMAEESKSADTTGLISAHANQIGIDIPFQRLCFTYKVSKRLGNRPSLFNKKHTGFVEANSLVLSHLHSPVTYEQLEMAATGTGDEFVGIIIHQPTDDVAEQLWIQSAPGGATNLITCINRQVSEAHAHIHRDQAAEAGVEPRIVTCPLCGCLVITTGCAQTPQWWCSGCSHAFRNTEFTPHDTATGRGDQVKVWPSTSSGEQHLDICPGCGNFGDVGDWTRFLFLFLLFVYFIEIGKLRRCPSCIRDTVWCWILTNVLFLIALPHSIYVLVKSSKGMKFDHDYSDSDNFALLHKGNLASVKGNFHQAYSFYEQILSTGVASGQAQFNLAYTLMLNGDQAEGIRQLDVALKMCGNLHPALNVLVGDDAMCPLHIEPDDILGEDWIDVYKWIVWSPAEKLAEQGLEGDAAV